MSDFCIPDEPTQHYVFTPAWVDKIVKEIGTPQKFEAFFGTPPRKGKAAQIGGGFIQAEIGNDR